MRNYLWLTLLFVLVNSSLLFSQESGQGKATWYGKALHGRRTASGEVFNMHNNTTASNIHKFGTLLKVTNKANGKSVIVKVTDRGGFTKYGRVLDLSYNAFKTIAKPSTGVITVTYEVCSNKSCR